MVGHRECQAIVSDIRYDLSDYLDRKSPEHPLFYTMAPVDNTNMDLILEDEDIQRMGAPNAIRLSILFLSILWISTIGRTHSNWFLIRCLLDGSR
jgi:hypothetical protein